jgi:hypothetical protein
MLWLSYPCQEAKSASIGLFVRSLALFRPLANDASPPKWIARYSTHIQPSFTLGSLFT